MISPQIANFKFTQKNAQLGLKTIPKVVFLKRFLFYLHKFESEHYMLPVYFKEKKYVFLDLRKF